MLKFSPSCGKVLTGAAGYINSFYKWFERVKNVSSENTCIFPRLEC